MMKKSLNVFAAVWITFFAAIMLAACSSDEHNSADEAGKQDELADYTIILYGTGGGNLDECMEANLLQVAKATYTSKVNFVAQVRYSVTWKDYAGAVVNYEWEKDPKSPTGGKLMEYIDNSNPSYFMTFPDNITKYIDEQVERFPAKKYILLTWNHGGGFQAQDGQYNPDVRSSRAMMWDENAKVDGDDWSYLVPEFLSIYELEAALKQTELIKRGEKFDIIYTDMCLMGGIENVYQLQPYTNYFLGAAHVTPGEGGDYDALVTHFAACGLNTPEAVKKYIDETVSLNYWPNDQDYELFCYDMSKLPEVVNAFRPISQKMIAHYENLSERERAQFVEKLSHAVYRYAAPYRYTSADDTYRVSDRYPFYDWAELVKSADYTGKSEAETQKFVQALNDARVYCKAIKGVTVRPESVTPHPLTQGMEFYEYLKGIYDIALPMPEGFTPGLSICFFSDETYYKEREEGNSLFTYDDSYPHARFHKEVKWGDLLKLKTLSE